MKVLINGAYFEAKAIVWAEKIRNSEAALEDIPAYLKPDVEKYLTQ